MHNAYWVAVAGSVATFAGVVAIHRADIGDGAAGQRSPAWGGGPGDAGRIVGLGGAGLLKRARLGVDVVAEVCTDLRSSQCKAAISAGHVVNFAGRAKVLKVHSP